jgi:radical SAM protein with 4Fe4S-binding SPASM domain
MNQLYPLEYMYKNLIIENCTIEITDQCNFKCIHCDYPKKIKGQFMSLETFNDVINQLKKLGTFRVTVTGGEPFEHPMILDFIDSLNKESFFIKVITNGFHMTPEQNEALKRMPKVELAFSLLGVEQTHERITGINGSYKKIIDNILKLKEGKCKISTQTCVLQQNYGDLSHFVEFIKSLNVNCKLDPYVTNTLKNHTMELFRLSNNQLIQYYRKFTNMSRLTDKIIREKELIRLKSCDCGVARNTVAISPYGDVFPCSNIRISAGNVFNKSVEDIWLSSPVILDFRSRVEKPRSKCNVCKMSTLCNQCMAMAITEQGDWRLPSLESCRHMECLQELG